MPITPPDSKALFTSVHKFAKYSFESILVLSFPGIRVYLSAKETLLTLKSFVNTIEKFGMKVIDPQGEPFNPEQHQAMSMQENAELPPNTVLAVMQKGYEINGRLLRPAMVMVTRSPDGGVDTQA